MRENSTNSYHNSVGGREAAFSFFRVPSFDGKRFGQLVYLLN